MPLEYELIQDRSGLKDVCSRLWGEPLLAVDVEADSLYHYTPRVCLVQISSSKRNFLIDPLSIGSLGPLRSVLYSKKVRKLFHGGDYDLRSLFRDFSICVNNIFDTMIGSQFVGDEEPGLAAVIHRRFGITLDKKYQKANWSRRPLSDEMLSYAAHDTAHLLDLYKQVREELTAKGRLAWVEEECHRLAVACTSNSISPPDISDPDWSGEDRSPLFKRFRGAGTMSPRDLAVLENLLVFRERAAMRQDKPPFKVFGNELIKTLTLAKPTTKKALEELPRLPRNFVKRYGEPVLAAVRHGLSIPENRLPRYPSSPRPPYNPDKQLRLKRLKRWRRRCADRLQLPPGLICNNTLLDLLAESHPSTMRDLEKIPELRQWQRDVFGQEVLQALNAKTDPAPRLGKER